ncbi:alpha/beta fold hydrolase [Rhizobium leguminosarum]|uniref:alpha/beta fold hydrolase n=1 Tax=Rhizobium leguminosarum TaxID=384 RepID=UPI00143F23F6|nr:alpha/beta hydrolase [Rhizobium leguminosarum]NKL21236.1 alpha/beta fold hydrolase [Rhizobium leguminosarum bv. viciae]NKL56743.1 alpha/beta fold hydrolase [Rhizobium leguminosarum bv. viciae]
MGTYDELRNRLREAASDIELRRLVAGLKTTVAIRVGERVILIEIEDPDIRVTEASAETSAAIVISASDATWAEVNRTPPPATFHSFTAFQLANSNFAIEGAQIDIARARPALERLFEKTVRAHTMAAPAVERDLSLVTGKYKSVNVAGGVHDIYFEESGQGTPILFLHTAGADGRQFLAQLSDVSLTKSHRLIAVDLPFHGRSMPPLSWNGATYKLTAEKYLIWCTAILEQLVDEKAIVAGGSMGAAMAMVLAAERPSLLKGIIAIEPPFQSKGRRNPYQHNANVHGSLHNASYVRGLMSPMSPEASRRRASWIYSQGAPGIYPGDLAFYSDEFNGAVTAPKIDGKRTPTVLLSGDYDYSATPADGAKLAELIPGSCHLTMPGLGHFPMCEHPDYFRAYFTRALQFIEESSR